MKNIIKISKSILIVLFLIFMNTLAQAKVGGEPDKAVIQIIHGHLQSSITVDNKNIKFKNTNGLNKTSKFNAKNFGYLKRQIASLKGTNNKTKYCSRNHIIIKAGKSEKVACIGSKNKRAEEMLKLVNLLSYYY